MENFSSWKRDESILFIYKRKQSRRKAVGREKLNFKLASARFARVSVEDFSQISTTVGLFSDENFARSKMFYDSVKYLRISRTS